MQTIEGFEDYAVTEEGRVWSKRGGSYIKPKVRHNGYYIVTLRKSGKPKDRLLHRLVALAYIPNPDNLPEVNHLDGDKSNCAKWNLAWVTHSSNMYHAFETRLKSHVGNKSINAKLTESDVEWICKMLQAGDRRQYIVDMVPDLKHNNLVHIATGRNWCHVSYKYGIIPRRWPEHLPYPEGVDTTLWKRYSKPKKPEAL